MVPAFANFANHSWPLPCPHAQRCMPAMLIIVALNFGNCLNSAWAYISIDEKTSWMRALLEFPQQLTALHPWVSAWFDLKSWGHRVCAIHQIVGVIGGCWQWVNWLQPCCHSLAGSVNRTNTSSLRCQRYWLGGPIIKLTTTRWMEIRHSTCDTQSWCRSMHIHLN